MKEYFILIKDHGITDSGPLWLKDYKLKGKENILRFMTTFAEHKSNAGIFEEDDYILDIIKSKFKDYKLIPVEEHNVIPIQQDL